MVVLFNHPSITEDTRPYQVDTWYDVYIVIGQSNSDYVYEQELTKAKAIAVAKDALKEDYVKESYIQEIVVWSDGTSSQEVIKSFVPEEE